MPPGLGAAAQPAVNASFRVLAYHDVLDEPLVAPDRYTVSTRNLAEHFAWLRSQRPHDREPRGRAGGARGDAAAATKAVLLIFDDGFRSVYTRVFPLLQAFKVPRGDRPGRTLAGRRGQCDL